MVRAVGYEPPARLATSAPLRYEAREIRKAFDGTNALHGVSVVFEPGEIHTLVGENGAGKSTLLRIMAGIYTPDAGELLLDGQPLGPLTPRAAQRRGIYLVPQEPTLMSHLTALENLFVGILPRGRFPFSVDWRQMRRAAGGYFEQLGLDIDPDQTAETLSIAQQQLLECARALAHRCTVIFFDEPTSPLTAHEAEVLFDLMRRLREQRFTLAFISHRLDEVLELSDRVTVLRDANVTGRFDRHDVSREALVSAMIGHEMALAQRTTRATAPGGPVLEVSGLTRPAEFTDISFEIRSGEVVGLAGLVGSGRTEIAETVFGLRRETAGSVAIGSRRLAHRNPRVCIDAGLIYLSEDRGRTGIFADVELTQNITAAVIPRLPRSHRLLSPGHERALARGAMERTHVRTLSADPAIKTLSGGNQQRAMFSRWLLSEPKVAIFDEPTRGVDVGAKADIYAIIDALAEAGVGILVISSELEELSWTCDRVLAIYEGRIVGALVGEEITLSALGQLIVGEVT
jgi:ABC-type sugar transport system ATPase subunit